MWTTKFRTGVAVIVAMAGGGLLAKPANSADEPAPSAEMAQVEEKLANLRELIRPQPAEHVTNMAKIAWQRDPWVAAVKAGKEGKPVLVYAEGAAGIACGYG